MAEPYPRRPDSERFLGAPSRAEEPPPPGRTLRIDPIAIAVDHHVMVEPTETSEV